MYVSKVSDSRRFSKTIKPRFSSKWKTENTIILTLGDRIFQNEKLKVNTLFCWHYKTPKLKRIQILMATLYLLLLNTSKTIKVIKTKEKYYTQENSFFVLFSKDELLKAINSLPSNNTCPLDDIPINPSRPAHLRNLC